MFRKVAGFTLLEVMVAMTIAVLVLVLATPSWERAIQKRKLTNTTEQVAAFLLVAQSEAQKSNQAVSLVFNRVGNQDWCVGSSIGSSACDCRETNSASLQYCAVNGVARRIESSMFQSAYLIQAFDTQPGSGDSVITFDPIRGILQPAGDVLQLTFGSASNEFQLRLVVGPTGLFTLCNPDSSRIVGGYKLCAA
jgi:prepilin-type N-terminal cleavage/methylation domain-containing protein